MTGVECITPHTPGIIRLWNGRTKTSNLGGTKTSRTETSNRGNQTDNSPDKLSKSGIICYGFLDGSHSSGVVKSGKEISIICRDCLEL